MPTGKNHQTVGPDFANKVEVIKVVYDFAVDAGAVGTIKLLTFAKKCVIVRANTHVVTACTSGGSATVKIGTTGDDDAVIDTTDGAVASLTLDKLYAGKTLPTKVAAADVLNLVIGTAALTAGKIAVTLEVLPLD
jgi:hypothetical protein